MLLAPTKTKMCCKMVPVGIFHPLVEDSTNNHLFVAHCSKDLVVIPLYVFDMPDSPVLIFFEWCTQLFWNFDIALSMHTGNRASS